MLRRFIGKFGLDSEDIKNLSIAALIGRLTGLADDDTKAELAEVKLELQRAQDDAANARRKAASDSEQATERNGSHRAELKAEIETLRKAEQRARKDVASLKAQLAVWEERARHQHDLFGGPAEDAALSAAIAEKLEALAIRAEGVASELEAKATSH